jgi:zinc transport system substrate-binding protein
MKKILSIIGMFVLILTLTACKTGNGDDTPVVYVTVYPMQYLVEEIVGDTVNVKRVPGASSHGESVDWSAKEIIDMLEADLLFYVHGGADDYVPNNEETVFSDGDVELVDMSQHIEYNLVCYSHDHDEEHTEEEHMDETCDGNALSEDPHFWLDPVRMLQAATFVKDKLLSTYPENAELYNNNFTVLRSALEKLDEDFQEMADAATKPIITTVMLFTYWHESYDIEIIPITNDAHSTEANAGDIIEIVEHAVEDGIMYVLFEKNANSPAGTQVLEALQEEVPLADVLYLHGLGNLTQTEIDNGSTYLSIMYDNLTTLDSATK